MSKKSLKINYNNGESDFYTESNLCHFYESEDFIIILITTEEYNRIIKIPLTSIKNYEIQIIKGGKNAKN
ncbi:MAG: hypothetical protein QXY65_06665 [Candidatus Methanomethylicaceae archaeon]